MFPQVWELLILRRGVALFADYNKSSNAATPDYKVLPLLHRPVVCWIKCRSFDFPSFSELVSRVVSKFVDVVIVPVYFLAQESCAWYDAF